ncbi:MAG TPA: cytochrome P460 family protein, partial [Bryobacteraceae bacterium]|nr:cytochrome P460 family protein [Bryobacteraceae bacterium]
ARQHLNFSEIGMLPAAQQKGLLYEAVNQIRFHAMPLPAYARLHPSAALAPAQVKAIEDYLRAASESDAASAKLQPPSETRTVLAAGAHSVAAAPNGIPFPEGYQHWKWISTTDRFDNQSIRAVLGNPIAVQAARDHRGWPDGAMLAKVAWVAQPRADGRIEAGSFWQVEFMIRDQQKYAATKGWGWARWRTSDLKPYGKGAQFAEECVGCHAPLRDSDYIFTPIHPDAAPKGDLPWNPLQGDVITSILDRGAASISTLYGNDSAVQYARSHVDSNYPAGASVSLVTWNQKDDENWFGARVPGQVKSVEFVNVADGPDQRPAYSYQRYSGSPLTRMGVDPATAEERTAYLLSLRAAGMP